MDIQQYGSGIGQQDRRCHREKAGTVTITAQYEGKKYTCKIFAEEPQLVTEKTTMIKGQKQTLTVSGTKLKVRWSSSNPSVASVSAQGVLTAKRVGDTVVSATVGGKKFSETVTVEVPALSDTSLTIVKNQKKKITLNGTAQEVTWSVGNEAIASVSTSGVITGKKVGNTNVFAVVDGVRYICKLRVDGPYLSRKSLTMTQGTTQQLYGARYVTSGSLADQQDFCSDSQHIRRSNGEERRNCSYHGSCEWPEIYVQCHRHQTGCYDRSGRQL